jgi:uncharacterized SAM-binding protein YcdF (DUF218 family)
MKKQKSGQSRLVFYTLLSLVLLACLAVVAFRYVGYWLVLDDPLEHSTAIVVMGGGFPYRPAKAAELYKEGWAKEVWLTQGSRNDRDRDLDAFGMPQTAEHESGHWLLRKLGVPDRNIRIVPQPVDNTMTELRAVHEYATGHGGGPLIIVTSKQHTRRVRVIWNAVVGNSMRVAVRSTPREAYNEAHWWRTTTDALATVRETFGILNVWAGFPIAPREH